MHSHVNAAPYSGKVEFSFLSSDLICSTNPRFSDCGYLMSHYGQKKNDINIEMNRLNEIFSGGAQVCFLAVALALTTASTSPGTAILLRRSSVEGLMGAENVRRVDFYPILASSSVTNIKSNTPPKFLAPLLEDSVRNSSLRPSTSQPLKFLGLKVYDNSWRQFLNGNTFSQGRAQSIGDGAARRIVSNLVSGPSIIKYI